MHECPMCGEVCDCDMDDTWGLPMPDDCPHVCADVSEDDELEDDDLKPDQPEVCQWELMETEDENIWKPSCDEFELWHFESGGPEDNHMRYCPFCGRPLVVINERIE